MTEPDCLATRDEADAVAHAIPDCRLEEIPGTNHYTILLGEDPRLREVLRSFLGG